MSTESTMLYERSRPSIANGEDVGLTPSEACRLIAICIDLIDLVRQSDREDRPGIGVNRQLRPR